MPNLKILEAKESELIEAFNKLTFERTDLVVGTRGWCLKLLINGKTNLTIELGENGFIYYINDSWISIKELPGILNSLLPEELTIGNLCDGIDGFFHESKGKFVVHNFLNQPKALVEHKFGSILIKRISNQQSESFDNIHNAKEYLNDILKLTDDEINLTFIQIVSKLQTALPTNLRNLRKGVFEVYDFEGNQIGTLKIDLQADSFEAELTSLEGEVDKSYSLSFAEDALRNAIYNGKF